MTKFTYSWLRCAPDGTSCAAVPGASSTAYTLTRSDVGFTMRFRVIASNDGGDSQPAQSTPTAVVQRGVISAKLALSPNPTCTGVPTTFDASGSASRDGIKSYSFRVIDLYAATIAANHGKTPDTEGLAEFYERDVLADSLLHPLTPEAIPYLINNFAGPPKVTDHASVIYNFNWDRAAIYNLAHDAEWGVFPAPADLVRDDIGVVVEVTDHAGHTARAVGALYFVQRLLSGTRAGCPTAKRFRFTAPNSVLTAGLRFPRGGSQPTTTASCVSRVTCVGTIAVAVRSCNSCAVDAAHRQSLVLASGFFKIPPHRKRKVVLKLTRLGKRGLHRGARVPVRITVLSAGPTGRTVKHVYSQVLTR